MSTKNVAYWTCDQNVWVIFSVLAELHHLVTIKQQLPPNEAISENFGHVIKANGSKKTSISNPATTRLPD